MRRFGMKFGILAAVAVSFPTAFSIAAAQEQPVAVREPEERVTRLAELVSPVTLHTEEPGTPGTLPELVAALETAEAISAAEAERQRRIAEELAWIAQQQQEGEQPAATLAPEPATLLLLASGLISLGIAGMLRRRGP